MISQANTSYRDVCRGCVTLFAFLRLSNWSIIFSVNWIMLKSYMYYSTQLYLISPKSYLSTHFIEILQYFYLELHLTVNFVSEQLLCKLQFCVYCLHMFTIYKLPTLAYNSVYNINTPTILVWVGIMFLHIILLFRYHLNLFA